MKHVFILAFIFSVFNCSVYARDYNFKESSSKVEKSFPMDRTLSGGERDTIYPPSVALDCVNGSADLQILTLTQTQWLFGCNSYSDTEAAQVYDFGETYYEISGALAWIQKMGTAGSAYCKIYSVNQSTNQPHALIATSEPLLNSSLPIDPSLTQQAYFHFSEPVKVTGKFAIAIQYFCELAQGSAMGLASSAVGCVINDDKLSWILDSDGVWFSSQEYKAGDDVLKTDLYIAPIAEVVSSVHGDSEIKLSINPNPATEVVSISGIKDAKEVKIIDTVGILSFQSYLSDQNILNIDLDRFAKGCYFIQLVYANGNIETKNLIIE